MCLKKNNEICTKDEQKAPKYAIYIIYFVVVWT